MPLACASRCARLCKLCVLWAQQPVSRTQENKEVYEGEVTELAPEETESSVWRRNGHLRRLSDLPCPCASFAAWRL